jgi:hypothetical protein
MSLHKLEVNTHLTPKYQTYDCRIKLSINTQFFHLIFRENSKFLL